MASLLMAFIPFSCSCLIPFHQQTNKLNASPAATRPRALLLPAVLCPNIPMLQQASSIIARFTSLPHRAECKPGSPPTQAFPTPCSLAPQCTLIPCAHCALDPCPRPERCPPSRPVILSTQLATPFCRRYLLYGCPAQHRLVLNPAACARLPNPGQRIRAATVLRPTGRTSLPPATLK